MRVETKTMRNLQPCSHSAMQCVPCCHSKVQPEAMKLSYAICSAQPPDPRNDPKGFSEKPKDLLERPKGKDFLEPLQAYTTKEKRIGRADTRTSPHLAQPHFTSPHLISPTRADGTPSASHILLHGAKPAKPHSLQNTQYWVSPTVTCHTASVNGLCREAIGRGLRLRHPHA